MSGPKVASKTTAGGPAMSAGDRKLIAFVKEVATSHSDEEIYAMLKECNRNPDEAAQRLLNEDNFHVVKRKKDKKKEVRTNKDASDIRQSNSGSFGGGGKSYGTSGGRGAGRGTSLLRTNNNEGIGGRIRAPTVKENGVPSYAKTSSTSLAGSLSYSQLVQSKSSLNSNINNSLTSSNGDSLQATVTPSLEGAWPCSSGFGNSAMLQGAWLAGSCHGTIADMLKGAARKSGSISGDVMSSAPVNTSSEHLSVSSLHLSPLDAVASLSYDPHTRSPGSAVKRETRFSGDVPSYGLHEGDSAHYVHVNNSNVLSVERDSVLLQPTDLNHSAPLDGEVQTACSFLGGQSHSVSDADVQECQTEGLSSPFNGALGYQHQQFVESQNDNDWGSDLVTHDEDRPVEVISESTVLDGPSLPAANLQETSFCDNHSVIIPDHIRVPEAECTMLSFGSFDVGFNGISSNPTVISEDKNHSYESADVNDLAAAIRSLSTSLPTSAILEHEQPISSSSVQSLRANVDINSIEEETGSKEEEDLSQQPAQHEYPPGYSVMSAVSSDHAGHYTVSVEETEARPRQVNAVMPSYENSTYYSGVFRSVPELDSRYSAFSQLAASGKLGTTSRPAETSGQSASSQEVLHASIYPSSNVAGGQVMPAVNNGPSTMTLPQHSIHPYAAQPSGLPLAPFANVLGYQYMPPGFSYVQSPYQHNYVGTGSYHQVPAAVGAGAMKYPVPEYKTGVPAVGGMPNTISANSLGYGGYPNTQSASTLPATSGNTSTFEDTAAQHYKDNMYMPSQQIGGPSAWLQAQLIRDAQGSSYYNVPGQSQPTRYSQAQSLLTHAAHPGTVYGSLYHPQQSGSSPSAHQLFQQQQALSSMGGLGSQVGSYQQNQRAQPTWAPGPY